MEDNEMNQDQYNQNQENQYQNQEYQKQEYQEYQNPNQNFNQNQNQYQNTQGAYNHQPKPFLPSYDVNAFSILALVMGVMGLSTESSLVGGILAIVFSEMAKKRVRPTDTLGIKFAKAGLVLGIISLVFTGLGFIGNVIGLTSELFSDFYYYF
ncbi:MAG: DUF4190 domain-containing protein [Lachnospiraceae bacterium]